MIYIWADFNYSAKLLPLRFKGSFDDIRRQNVDLREGLRIIVYDDQCQADAIVEKIQGEWWTRVTSEIRNVDSEPGRPG